MKVQYVPKTKSSVLNPFLTLWFQEYRRGTGFTKPVSVGAAESRPIRHPGYGSGARRIHYTGTRTRFKNKKTHSRMKILYKSRAGTCLLLY